MEKLKIGILGATGLVGQHFVSLLANHPYFQIDFLSASNNSKGKTYKNIVNWRLKEKLPENIKNIELIDTKLDSIIDREAKIIFSALPSNIQTNIERELRANNECIFSNSSINRMDNEIPIIVTEVNNEHFELAKIQKGKYGGFIVTNPNCVVSGFSLVLKPLNRFNIKSIAVSTYQAISGAGINGISAFDINSNAIPYIKNEEEKIENETIKILSRLDKSTLKVPSFSIMANCCRIGVLVGHLESIILELEKEVSVEEIKEALISFTSEAQKLNLPTAPKHSIIVSDKIDRPQPILDSYLPETGVSGMSVVVGKIRKKENKISLFLLVNNLIRGAAGQSILNSEYAFKKFFI